MSNGFFSFLDVTKGKDQSEPKHPFVRFWYRYANRFFHLIRVNLVFFLITLPFFVWAMTLYNSFIVSEGLKNIALLPALIVAYMGNMPSILLIILVVISIVMSGPAWAGLTFVASRYTQGRHAWPWADFRKAFIGNFKTAVFIGPLDALIIFITYYYQVENDTVFGAFGGMAKLIWFILMIIYMCCRIYLFPMMVSVELPLRQHFKNALILAMVKPLRTLLCIIIILILVILCSFADMILLPLFAYAFFAFASSAVTYPVIKTFLLEPAEKTQNHSHTPK